MILLTNGCSWTYGGGLNLDKHEQTEERLSKVWPHHLGQMLGAKQVVNLAAGCGSNQRIFRTTFDWVTQNINTDEKIIAVIQFTEPSRYEFYNTKDPYKDFTNLPDKWALVKTHVCLNGPKDYHKTYQISQQRFYLYSIIEGMYSMLRDCAALENIFNKHNIQYHFWQALLPTDVDNQLSTYISENFNFLDFYCKWEYERISKNDTHPSLLGHQQIAEYIYDEINLDSNKSVCSSYNS